MQCDNVTINPLWRTDAKYNNSFSAISQRHVVQLTRKFNEEKENHMIRIAI